MMYLLCPPILLGLFIALSTLENFVKAEVCKQIIPLGLSNGQIKSNQIQASSVFRGDANNNANQARLHLRTAWCGNKIGQTWPEEYLTVDFGKQMLVHGVASQGDPNYAANIVTGYYLSVSKDNINYTDVKTKTGKRQLFSGGTYHHDAVYNWLDIPIQTQFIRFKPVELYQPTAAHVCARLEYFGCVPGFGNNVPSLGYPLGLENGEVENNQMTSSGINYRQFPYFGRLNNEKGWCVKSGSGTEWIQIDFKRLTTVTAVTIQGHGDMSDVQFISQYRMQASNDSNVFLDITSSDGNPKIFQALSSDNQVPIYSALPFPFTGRYFRVIPLKGGPAAKQHCMRLELYGYGRNDCNGDITWLSTVSSSNTKSLNLHDIIVNSDKAVCFVDNQNDEEFIRFEFARPMKVSGVGLQSNPNNITQLEEFQIEYLTSCGTMKKLEKNFTGNLRGVSAEHVWFGSIITTSSLKIIPLSWNGTHCARVQVHGCLEEIPTSNKITVGSGLAYGGISESQLSASSVKDNNPQFNAAQARLRSRSVWCSNLVGKDQLTSEWLRVDFKEERDVIGIAIQGNLYETNDYVKSFTLKYESAVDGAMIDYKDTCFSSKVLPGNFNNNQITYNWLQSPLRTKSIRISASPLVWPNTPASVCFRMEIFQQRQNTYNASGLFALGMESGLLKDNQLSSSGYQSNSPSLAPSNARLNGISAWCAATTSLDEYLMIDFMHPMRIEAIATQGHGNILSNNKIASYYISYSDKKDANSFVTIKTNQGNRKLFVGNVKTGMDAVYQTFDQAVTTRYLKFMPQKLGDKAQQYCMRMELFGRHGVCANDFTRTSTVSSSSQLISNPTRFVHLNSRIAWCSDPADSNPFVTFDIGSTKVISGVALQNDPERDYSTTDIQLILMHGQSLANMMVENKTYIGPKSRNGINYHWFTKAVFARFIQFKINKSTQRFVCQRIGIFGCNEVPPIAMPLNTTVNVASVTSVNLQWEHSPVDEFIVKTHVIQYKKPTESQWMTIEIDQPSTSYTLTNLSAYAAYDVRIKCKNPLAESSFSKPLRFFTGKVPTKGPYVAAAQPEGIRKVGVLWAPILDTGLAGNIKGYYIIYTCIPSPDTRPCTVNGPQNITVMNGSSSTTTLTNLLPWTKYSIEMKAFNPIGVSPSSAPTYVITLEEAPSAALKILSHVTSKGSVNISVEGINATDANGLLSGYNITIHCVESKLTRDCASSRPVSIILYGYPQSNITVDGLTSWTKYQIYAYAFNLAGDSPPSNGIIAITQKEKPSFAPNLLNVNALSSKSINVSWESLEKDQTNGILTSYSVEFMNIRNGTAVMLSASPTVLSHVFDSLRPFSKYSVRIAAVNNEGTGPFSSSMDVMTLEDYPSGSPSGLRSILASANSISLLWSAIEPELANGIVRNYIIKVTSMLLGSQKMISVATSNNTNFTRTIDALMPFTNYSIKVAVNNSIGLGPFSQEIVIQTSESAPVAAPTILSISAKSMFAEVNIMGINASLANGILLGYHAVYSCKNSTQTRYCPSDVETMNKTFSLSSILLLSDLLSWTTYGIKIQVFNKAGVGPLTNDTEFSTKEDAPSKPPTSDGMAINSTALNITWEPISRRHQNGELAAYFVHFSTSDYPATVTSSIRLSSSKLFHIISGLVPFTEYNVSVAAATGAGIGPFSTAQTIRTLEAAPIGQSIIMNASSTAKSLLINVHPILKNESYGTILGYKVHYNCVITSITRTCASNTTYQRTIPGYPAMPLILNNVDSWTIYMIQLAVYNSAGVGPISKPIYFSTLEEAPSGAPLDVTAFVNSSTSLTFAWQQVPYNERNGILTGYNVTLNDHTSYQQYHFFVSVPSMNYYASSLMPYHLYSINVSAVNAIGKGPAGLSTKVRTLQDVPSEPRTITITGISSSSVNVKWNTPEFENGLIQGYDIVYCRGNCTTVNTTGSSNSIIIKGLVTFVWYTFKVRARNIFTGPYSNETAGRTLEGIPGKPGNVSITKVTEVSLSLTWQPSVLIGGNVAFYEVYLEGRKTYNISFKSNFSVRAYCNNATSCLELTIVNVTASTLYTIKVAAATNHGYGPVSETVTATTKAARPLQNTMTKSEDFVDGGTVVNLIVYPVTDINGPIESYQVIVEKHESLPVTPRVDFNPLYGEQEADEQGHSYFLALDTILPKEGLKISFLPGQEYVDLLGVNLNLPGIYSIYTRVKAKEVQGRPALFSVASHVLIDRDGLPKIPKQKVELLSSNTITITLPSFQQKSQLIRVYIIVLEITTLVDTDPKQYDQADLIGYDETTYSAGVPYITAVLTKAEYDRLETFTIGDGKQYDKQRKRRSVINNFVNAELHAESNYTYFIRAENTNAGYYSSPWQGMVSTKAAVPIVPPSKESYTMYIVFAGVACIMIIVVIIALIVCRRRGSETFKQHLNHTTSMETVQSADRVELKERTPSIDTYLDRSLDYEYQPPQSNNLSTFSGIASWPESLILSRHAKYRPIWCKDIAAYVNEQRLNEDNGFEKEFRDLASGQLYSWEEAMKPINKPKNRFANIVAYDHSRVKLPDGRASNYINANFMRDYSSRVAYIGCQAPTESAIADFWLLIWEQNVPAIVMLTNLVENGKKKSEQYWPINGITSYESISVMFVSSDIYSDFNITTLQIQKKGTKDWRELKHYHYTSWPDHGVPAYPTSLLSFQRRIRQAMPFKDDSILVVHCSAGVGRAGTFIAIDALIPIIDKEKFVDVFNFVNYMRKHRVQMVQRTPQYKFIYESLLEYVACGVTEFSIEDMTTHLTKLKSTDPQSGMTGYAKEFKMLMWASPQYEPHEYSTGKQLFNSTKNRFPYVVPRNVCRVFLPCHEYTEGADYINACFVDGQREKDAFIGTQAPLDSTISDFWRMIVDRNATVIVSLTCPVENGQRYPVYIPDKGEKRYDDMLIAMKNRTDITDDLVLTEITVTDETFKEVVNTVHHYHYMGWKDHSVPSSTEAVINLIQEVEKSKQKLNGGPLVVQCSNGAGRTGTFITLYTSLLLCRDERLTDIFQTVRRIRAARPEFVENEEQYKFCYDTVEDFLTLLSTYSNLC